MALAYKRKYSLFIGRPVDLVNKVTQGNVEVLEGQDSTKDASVAEDFNTEPENLAGIQIDGLQITANIKSNKGNANSAPATIEVYNLSRDNRARLKVKDTIILRAGYENTGDIPLVFAGQIASVFSEKSGDDIKTTIVCDGSFVPRRWIRFSKSFPKGSTTADILLFMTGIAKANGVGLGNLSIPASLNKVYPSGYSAVGNLFDNIKTFATDNGLKCYMVLGKFYIEPNDTATTTTQVSIKSENILTIKEEQDSTTTVISDEMPSVGLKVTTFLQGNITLNAIAQISVKDYEGSYEITSVNHVLDFRGKRWQTVFSCRRI